MSHRPSSVPRLSAFLALSILAVACGGTVASSADSASESEVRTDPAFLDAAAYSSLLTINPAFPFGVTRKHVAAGAVLGARWGRHGGPIVTTQSFSSPTDPLKVNRWTLPPAPTAAALRTELSAVIAPNVPASHFWGVDGFVELPFGSLTMHAYSTGADNFPGEVLLYGGDYDRVLGRARVNGYYSGVGVTNGQANRLLYSGLSGLSAEPSSVQESGLYASDVCDAALVPTVACGSSVKLFGWSGYSGPVVADADGNVFVAAFVSGGTHSDAVYGLAKAQTFAGAPQAPATVAEGNSGGTGSLAAVSKPGSGTGWLIAKGYDGDNPAPAYARSYRSNGTSLQGNGSVVEQAIVSTSPSVSLSMFSDPSGHLWVAAEAFPDAWLFELQQKP